MPRVSIDFAPMSLYDQARVSINAGRYDRALEELNRLIQRSDGKPTAIADRVDASMYWKAYTQMKLQATADALATLQDLQKKYAESRWIKDAKALELEVRQASGQGVSPEAQNTEELKLLALRGLMNSDPDKALPMIQQLMTGNSSVTVKENALFVLSQSQSPRARDIILDTARNGSNPDVQLRAVKYLGMMRSTDTRPVLADVYKSTSDTAVKRAVIAALGRQQNDTALIELARAEKDPALKKQIVTYLSNMKTKDATDYMLELLK